MTVQTGAFAMASPAAERAAFGWAGWWAYETATAGTVAPTKAAPGAGKQYVIYKIIISASGTIAAAVEATLAFGATTVLPIEIPASATAPIVVDFGLRGLPVPANTAFTLTVTTLGTGIVCTAWVCGDTISAP